MLYILLATIHNAYRPHHTNVAALHIQNTIRYDAYRNGLACLVEYVCLFVRSNGVWLGLYACAHVYVLRVRVRSEWRWVGAESVGGGGGGGQAEVGCGGAGGGGVVGSYVLTLCGHMHKSARASAGQARRNAVTTKARPRGGSRRITEETDFEAKHVQTELKRSSILHRTANGSTWRETRQEETRKGQRDRRNEEHATKEAARMMTIGWPRARGTYNCTTAPTSHHNVARSSHVPRNAIYQRGPKT